MSSCFIAFTCKSKTTLSLFLYFEQKLPDLLSVRPGPKRLITYWQPANNKKYLSSEAGHSQVSRTWLKTNKQQYHICREVIGCREAEEKYKLQKQRNYAAAHVSIASGWGSNSDIFLWKEPRLSKMSHLLCLFQLSVFPRDCSLSCWKRTACFKKISIGSLFGEWLVSLS